MFGRSASKQIRHPHDDDDDLHPACAADLALAARSGRAGFKLVGAQELLHRRLQAALDFWSDRLLLHDLSQHGSTRGTDVVQPQSVEASRSEPNCAKAATSRYCASSSFSVPATCFMALICAALPTRLTERPTLTAGRMPL